MSCDVLQCPMVREGGGGGGVQRIRIKSVSCKHMVKWPSCPAKFLSVLQTLFVRLQDSDTLWSTDIIYEMRKTGKGHIGFYLKL